MWLLLVAVQPACQQPSASSSSPTRYRSFKSMLPDPKGLPHFAGSGSVEKKWQIRIRKMLSDLNIADLNQNLPKFLNYLGWKRGVPSLCDRKSRHCWRTHSLRWVTVIFLKYRTVLNIKKYHTTVKWTLPSLQFGGSVTFWFGSESYFSLWYGSGSGQKNKGLWVCMYFLRIRTQLLDPDPD